MRSLEVSDGGEETSLETFARDQLAICRAADSRDVAALRVWRAVAPSVSLGRYHRRPAAAESLVRRLTGGRPHAIGSGIVCTTAVYPALEWLAAGHTSLAPEQILNRALRPLLATVREAGLDAFYPGRDLITVAGKPVVVASFTTLPDGVLVVATAIAATMSFATTAEMIRDADPGGVVTFDTEALAGSTALVEQGRGVAGLHWAARLAEHAAGAHACRVTLATAPPEPSAEVRPAFDALQAERAQAKPGERVVYAVEMLGAIEAGALVEHGRITSFTLCGDLIASFATVEEVSAALVGQPPSRAATERALLGVLSKPGRFLLGLRDLPALVARLAE